MFNQINEYYSEFNQMQRYPERHKF